jgi:hypothetical protein
MKRIWLPLLPLLLGLGLCAGTGKIGMSAIGMGPTSDSLIHAVLERLSAECRQIRQVYKGQEQSLLEALHTVKARLRQRPDAATCVELLYAKDSLLEELHQLQLGELNDISRMRYRKGLQIIKILYEKVLGLDHHFAAVRTFNEISNLSNPNHYPDFKRLKETLQQSEKRKGFELTALLDKNIYTNIVGSLIKLFNTARERTEKTTDLKNIECIVDFTLQMHQDLKTIFYETAFLQQSNEGIKTGIEQLFKEYTKPIRYESTLANCRANDDWDRVEDLLDVYMRKLNEVAATKEMAAKTNKLQVNLEFQIDRLLQFIGQYNNFIDQGEKYYGKFSVVLTSYSNKQDCAAIIPQEYMKLSDDINIAINKFKTAYKPVEVNGSKLKELLYGVNDAE